MSDIRTRLENLLYQQFDTNRDQARSTVDLLLSLPGIAIVELPEAPWKYALGLGDVEDLYARDGLVIVSGIDAVSPTYARELAAALLAAASAAGRLTTVDR